MDAGNSTVVNSIIHLKVKFAKILLDVSNFICISAIAVGRNTSNSSRHYSYKLMQHTPRGTFECLDNGHDVFEVYTPVIYYYINYRL